MVKIKARDFVVLKFSTNGVPAMSVGIVKSTHFQTAIVYFVGQDVEIRVSPNLLRRIDVRRTGKGYTHKICNICHILQPTIEFANNQNDVKGQKTTRPSCRKCRKIVEGKKLSTPEGRRLNRIGPSQGDVFLCPICEKRTIHKITATAVRDHDHDTGMGRAWICDSCNTGLGRFQDSPVLLRRAIDYLESFD